MYDNYKGEALDIDAFAAKLQRRLWTSPDSTPRDGTQLQENDGGPHNQRQGGVSGDGHAGNGDQNHAIWNTGSIQDSGHSGGLPGHGDGATNGDKNNGNERARAEHNMASRGPKFFALCVNTGKFSIRLGEIDVTDVKNDGDLFRKIYTCHFASADEEAGPNTKGFKLQLTESSPMHDADLRKKAKTQRIPGRPVSTSVPASTAKTRESNTASLIPAKSREANHLLLIIPTQR